MSPFFLMTYSLLWILVLVLVLLVLLMYRHYGLMLLPAKEKWALGGLDVGRKVGVLNIADARGGAVSLTWDEVEADRVILYTSPECDICASIWAVGDAIAAEHPGVEFVWLSHDPHEKLTAPPAGWRALVDLDERAMRGMQVPALPYAHYVDSTGRVRAKGLMNDRTDFTRLIDAARAAKTPAMSSGRRS